MSHPWIKKLVSIQTRFAWFWVIIAFLSLGLSFYIAKGLQLRSNFKELLPENYQSVKELERTEDKVGGLSNLIVGIESPDFNSAKKFVDDLSAILRSDRFKESIKYVDSNTKNLKEYFNKNKYLYVELEDLQEIHDRLKRSIDHEKLNHTGLLIDFTDEDPDFDISDIEKKYQGESNFDQYTDGYFVGENNRLTAIVIRPLKAATSISGAKSLMKDVRRAIQELDPKKYHPDMKVGLAGKVNAFVREYNALISDIGKTGLIVLLGVALVVFVFYRNLRMVFLMTFMVILGASWTFALTQLKISYLTSQTAFLGSIIVGNGINFSLIFMARYAEERRKNLPFAEALLISFDTTWIATLASAITTSVGFGTLMLTEVKGFSHFGFMGGIGLFLCWVATYTFLPSFIYVSEKILPIKFREQSKKSLTSYLANLSDQSPKKIVKISAGITLIALISLGLYIPNSLEYDFNKLKFEATNSENIWEQELHHRVTEIFPKSLSPALILADTPEDAKASCEIILFNKEKLEKINPSDSKVDTCKSVFSYVPEKQEEKLILLSKMRELLNENTRNFMDEKERKKSEEFLETKDLKIISLTDLPEDLKNKFREKDGRLGRVIFVYSKKDAQLWDGKNLIKFASEIRETKLNNGKIIYGSGQAVIFSDLLSAVAHDGPIVILLSFSGIMLVVFLFFRNLKRSTLVGLGLLLGSLWQLMLIFFFQIKLNFLNFIALPTTFGIGVDYAVNLVQRYRYEGPEGMKRTLENTGSVIILCSLTTIIGYTSLIISNSRALASFGYLALLGEFACLSSALIALPAWIHYRNNKISTRDSKKDS